MSDDLDRALMYFAACQYAVENDTCAPSKWWCPFCHIDQLDAEAAALALDLAVSAAHQSRRSEPSWIGGGA